MKATTMTLALAIALCGCDGGEPARDSVPAAVDDARIGTPPPGDPDIASDQPPSLPGDEQVEGNVATVPERFRGDWAANTDACTTAGHVSRLHIGSDSIRFHESEGPILSADGQGDELTLVARLTGEGETRDATYAFTLSGDGNTLSDANGFTRQRCD